MILDYGLNVSMMMWTCVQVDAGVLFIWGSVDDCALIFCITILSGLLAESVRNAMLHSSDHALTGVGRSLVSGSVVDVITR
jgi:hypothetical protein